MTFQQKGLNKFEKKITYYTVENFNPTIAHYQPCLKESFVIGYNNVKIFKKAGENNFCQR